MRVRSVADLAPLFQHADLAYRAAAYSSILESPEKALQLAAHNGNDVIDLLVDTLRTTTNRSDRKTILAVIGQFDDPRANETFRTVLLEENDDELLHLAAQFVRERGLVPDRSSLLSLLRSGDNMSKVRIAAEFLEGQRPYDTADAIRVAAFSHGAEPFPEPNSETIDAWLSELQGPFQEFLLLTLERSDLDVDAWEKFWSRLGAAMRIWLVRRACCAESPHRGIIIQGLADEDDDVRLATLVGLRVYQPKIEALAIEGALDQAASSPSPQIRAACARLGYPGISR